MNNTSNNEEQVTSKVIFEPDQLLTADLLNKNTKYFDWHMRQTRTKLSGNGIVCGLEVSYNQNEHKITISKGCAVTSDGDIMFYDRDIDFTHYKEFLDTNAKYSSFFNSSGQQIKIFELKEQEDSETLKISDSINDHNLTDMTVVLYLESYEKKPTLCSGTECDNKGQIEHNNTKALLIPGPVLHDTIPAPEEYYDDLEELFLERIKLKLPETDSTIQTYEQLSDEYKKVISVFLESNKLITISNEIYSNENYKLLKSILEDVYEGSNPVSGWGNKFIDLLELVDQNVDGIQYIYDFLKDIIAAYNEFRKAVFELFKGKVICCPGSDLFPKHIMLGCANGDILLNNKLVRHWFYKSPILTERPDQVKKVQFLHKRIDLMIQNFHNSLSLQIRITPSKSPQQPLSQRAIPFYYTIQVLEPLNNFWNYKLNKWNKTNLIQSSHADKYNGVKPDFILNPLKYTLDEYPFFRIEGHIGKEYGIAIQQLHEEIKNNNLPIKVIGLKLGDRVTDAEVEFDCYLENLETMYRCFKSEYVDCFLEELLNYFSNLTITEPVVTKVYEGGLKGITGTVKDWTGNVPVDAHLSILNPVDNEELIITINGLGDFSTGLETIDDGEYKANFSAFGCETSEINFSIENGKMTNLGNIILKSKTGTFMSGVTQEYMDMESKLNTNTTGFFVKELYKTQPADLLSFADTYVKDYLHITDETEINIITYKVYYSSQIIQKIKELKGKTTNSLKALYYDDFETAFVKVIEAAGELNRKIIDNDLFVEQLRNEIQHHLNRLIYDCRPAKLKSLKAAYDNRFHEIQALSLFHNYIEKHPGMEHLAGVEKGGTFILVYDDSGTVVADFSLPYICCSDTRPIEFNIHYAPAEEPVPENPSRIESVTINPDSGYAKVGDSVVITVNAGDNEAGLTSSVAAINGKQVALADQGDGTYTGVYTILEGDNDASNVEATNITLTGPGGMSAPASSSGSTLIIDAHTPIISAVTISPNSGWVKTGDSVTITITTSNNEAGLTSSNAPINGKSVSLTDQGDGTYTGTYTVQAADAQGVNIEAAGITLTDAAGNVSAVGASSGSTLKVDTQAPTVASVIINPNTGTVTIGESVIITVTAGGNEAGLTASNASINGKSVSLIDQGGGTYTGTYTVQAADAQGVNIEATNITLTDAAGNVSGPASSAGSTLSVDTQPPPVPPTIASIAIYPNSGTITVGDDVIITATAGGNEAGLTALNAQINGKSIPLVDQENGTYRGAYTVQSGDNQGENIEATNITLADTAGNVSEPASSSGSKLCVDTRIIINSNSAIARVVDLVNGIDLSSDIDGQDTVKGPDIVL